MRAPDLLLMVLVCAILGYVHGARLLDRIPWPKRAPWLRQVFGEAPYMALVAAALAGGLAGTFYLVGLEAGAALFLDVAAACAIVVVLGIAVSAGFRREGIRLHVIRDGEVDPTTMPKGLDEEVDAEFTDDDESPPPPPPPDDDDKPKDGGA